MADALQGQQLGMGNLAGQGLAMTEGKQRIGRTVDHQGRRGDLVKRSARLLTLIDQRVVRHAGGHVVGTVDDPLHELWHEFMAELRTVHLGEAGPERDGPSVSERLAEVYAAAL